MARTLPSALHVARSALAQSQGWLLFVEIPRKAGGDYRLVQDNRHRSGDGKVWQAASIEVELPEETSEGTLGELVLTIPNISRLPMAAVELDDELLGQTVTAWLQHESSLDEFTDGLSWVHTVLRCRADESVVRLECGHPAAVLRIPGVRFTRENFPQLLPQGGVRT